MRSARSSSHTTLRDADASLSRTRRGRSSDAEQEAPPREEAPAPREAGQVDAPPSLDAGRARLDPLNPKEGGLMAGIETTHECPAPTCQERVPFAKLACRRHWSLVPFELQRRLLFEYGESFGEE